jgi:hypothetical protein
MLMILLLLLGLAVAFGVWRRFTSVQWIWLVAGSALLLVLVWALYLVFIIGPEMRRMGPPGTTRGF